MFSFNRYKGSGLCRACAGLPLVVWGMGNPIGGVGQGLTVIRERAEALSPKPLLLITQGYRLQSLGKNDC